MKRILSVIILCATSAFGWMAAQRIVLVSGEDVFYAPSTLSLEQAKKEALQQARKKVLEAKFGTTINSTTNIHLGNNDAEDASSHTEVQTISMNEVKGEWIEDTREPVQEISYDKSIQGYTIIRTQIWGKAREISFAKANIDVQLLKDTIILYDADVFQDGQSFYVSVQSPVAGYVAVYLLDESEDKAYCLLPAAADNRGAVPIKSNSRYVFFSEDYAARHYSTQDHTLGTEYILTATRSVLFNQLYVVFSPSEFYKANDKQEKSDKYILPRETTIQQFQKWLVSCKIHDSQLVSQMISFRIVK